LKHWNRKALLDKRAYFDLIGYTPHEGQAAFHASGARFRVMSCGWGWGKSSGAARDYEPLLHAPHVTGWIIAPSYQLGAQTFMVFVEDLLKLHGHDFFDELSETQLILRFPKSYGGSVLKVKSEAHPASLEAENVDFIIFDEASLMKESTYRRAYGRLRMGGEACFVFRPQGFGWVYDKFMRGQQPEFVGTWWSRTGPSWENPHIDPNFIADARRDLTEEAFESCIEGKFRTHVGSVFPEFDPAVHVAPVAYDKSLPLYGAIDYGYTNPFVWLWIQVGPDDVLRIVGERYVTHMSTEQHAQEMAAKGLTWAHLCDDPSGADERATLKRHGFKPIPVVSEVLPGIDALKRRLKIRPDGKAGVLVSPDCANTIREFTAYRYPERKSEREASENPVKADDHTIEALRRFVVWYDGQRIGSDVGLKTFRPRQFVLASPDTDAYVGVRR